MSGPVLEVRPMRRQEVGLALDWAAAEGWNPGLHDAAAFRAADPGGFFVGLLGGEPVAVISAVRYGRSYGFVGLYIVKPAHRGKGHGMAVWKAGLAYLEGRTVGLDGVAAQQENYRKSGFVWAHANARYEGRGGGGAGAEPGVAALASVPFAEVERFDRLFFPEARPAFLRAWISQPGAHALGIWRDGRLVASGVARPCRAGFKVGPLHADDAALADRLFTALRARVPTAAPLFLDVPACNPDAVALARRHGLVPVFETARMYAGPAPLVGLERTFGVTTFELG